MFINKINYLMCNFKDVTSTVLDVLLIRDLAFWILHVFILIGVSCYYIIKGKYLQRFKFLEQKRVRINI